MKGTTKSIMSFGGSLLSVGDQEILYKPTEEGLFFVVCLVFCSFRFYCGNLYFLVSHSDY